MTARKIRAYSLITALLLLLAASSAAPGCIYTANEELPEEIVIGALLPLSGNMQEYGIKAMKGMELAVSDINEEGGFDGAKLVIQYHDTAGDPENAVAGYISMAESGIPVVIGDITSAGTLAVAPYTSEYGVVLISPTATHPNITNYDHVYRIIASDKYQGRGAARIISILYPYVKTVAVVYADDEYGNGLRDAFLETEKSCGFEITGRIPLDADNDCYDEEVAMICDYKPDAIFLIGYTDEAGEIVRKVHEKGCDPVWFGTDSIVTEEFINSSGNLSEGITATMQSIRLDEDFRERYEEKYGNGNVDWIYCYAYETVIVLEEAIDLGGHTSDGIKEALGKVRHIGIIGPKVFDKNGDVPPSFDVLRVENGEWKQIKWREILQRKYDQEHIKKTSENH